MSFLGHPTGTKSGDGRPEDKDDLLVFGYACKLYRDDAKAIAEDSGVYLIPWMGDHSLMIDRYAIVLSLEGGHVCVTTTYRDTVYEIVYHDELC